MRAPAGRRVLTAAALAAAAACTLAVAGERLTDAMLSAGSFTVARFDRGAYSEPAAVLDAKRRQLFMAGRSVFNRQWAAIVSLNGDWGLGPTFVADRCAACHVNAGRGSPPPDGDAQLLSMLVRVSVPGVQANGAPMPHPHYGAQLQNRSLDGSHVDLAYGPRPVPPEAVLRLDWEERVVLLADGVRVPLRKPRLRIESLQFGPLGDDAMLSLRLAQPVFGLGLLDAVPEAELLAIARRQREQGFNGRPNYVWDAIAQRTAIGRYGWKAGQASLREQVAQAAIEDMGVASNLFPGQNCPAVQAACAEQLPGNVPEIIDHELDALELWLRGLAVPARRNVDSERLQRGEQLFADASCDVCHVPELRTANVFPALPALANQAPRAYTDLLLHDMGEALADGRPEYRAGARDWRTPPLWGLGLSAVVSGSSALLHDGRARNVTEAILWHGGEAAVSREAFRNFSAAEREALITFVESI
jgi:CxxC motif-containing protein (DUF1111 family)